MSGVNTASKHMKPGRRHRNRQAPQQQRPGRHRRDRHADPRQQRRMYVHKGKPVRARLRGRQGGNKVRVAKLGGGKTEVI